MFLDKKITINYIIMFLIMFIFNYIPPIGLITPLGMKILGVFIGAIYGWIMIDILPVTLISFIALALTNYKPIIELFTMAFTNTTIITILISVIFAGAITKTNCIDIVAKKLLTSKLAQKDPWNLVFIIFLLAILGHVCQMMFTTIFLLWALVLKLAEQCGYEKKSMFVTFMITMISILAVSTGLMFPWKPIVLAFTNFWDPNMYVIFPYAKHMFLVFIYLLLFVISIIGIAKYIIKMDISNFKLDEKTIQEYEEMKIEPIQKIGLILIISFALIMFIGSLIPTNTAIAIIFNKFGIIGISLLFLFILSLLKDKNNKNLINLQEAHNLIPWQIIWLLLFIIPLCEAMQSPECGIIAHLGQILIPMFGEMNITVFIIIALILISILT